jgi:hypothetical protein
MKKSIALFLFVALISLFFQACCKRELRPLTPVTTNINETLQENQSYQFTLPNNFNGQSYNMFIQPNHSSISYIGTDGSNNLIYRYTPALNYTGTDHVSFSDNTEAAGNCNNGCHGGGSCSQHNTCGHHQQCIRQNIINIYFTITPKNTAAVISTKEEIGIK